MALARRKLNSAVLREPKCRYPVGDGANLVLAGVVGSLREVLRLSLERLRRNDFDHNDKRVVQEMQIHSRLAGADLGVASITET